MQTSYTVEYTLETLKPGCVLLPLGSPSGSQKRPYVHVPVVPRRARQCVRHRSVGGDRCLGGYRVGYTGWVIRRAIPDPAMLLALSPPRRTATAGSGPCNAGWSGSRGGRPLREHGPEPPRGRPLHPPHPLQALQAFRGPLRWEGLLLGQTGEIQVNISES